MEGRKFEIARDRNCTWRDPPNLGMVLRPTIEPWSDIKKEVGLNYLVCINLSFLSTCFLWAKESKGVNEVISSLEVGLVRWGRGTAPAVIPGSRGNRHVCVQHTLKPSLSGIGCIKVRKWLMLRLIYDRDRWNFYFLKNNRKTEKDKKERAEPSECYGNRKPLDPLKFSFRQHSLSEKTHAMLCA